MFDSFVDILRSNPALAIFLTVGLGFFFGKLRIGSFSLGNVTSTLLVAVIIGQLAIPMSGPVKTVFFMLFLFSIGYSVGPGFFKSLRGSGAKQALFAVCMSLCCFGVTFAIAKLFGYTKGETVGLFSGSQTCSSLLGVGSEAIEKLGLPADKLKEQLDIMPVCYAVTYIFGTLGTVIILGNFGPALLGGVDKVRRQTLELEETLSGSKEDSDPAKQYALSEVDYRAYQVEQAMLENARSVEELEHYLHSHGLPVYVDRIRRNGKAFVPSRDCELLPDDELVVCGPGSGMVSLADYIGTEIHDPDILGYYLDRVGVVVSNKSFTTKTLYEIHRLPYMHGVVVRDAERDGEPLDLNRSTRFRKGDRLTLVGRPVAVEKASSHIGHVDRPSVASDLMFLGLAIFIGGLFGAITVWVGKVPLAFGTSGGALVSGLFFGWLRSKRPTYGNIPAGALWLMNNLGLNVFIAVVGLEAAPSFVSGIKAVGPMLFVAGAVGTTIPLLIGLWLGHKVFRFNPAITLGCCAGTRTCTASLGAVQNALGSTVPAISYTVTYTVANVLLVIWGMITVMFI